MGGVGAFSALREQTGGASLWRGALKVAHRILERTALFLNFDHGVLRFRFSGMYRLLESDVLRRVK